MTNIFLYCGFCSGTKNLIHYIFPGIFVRFSPRGRINEILVKINKKRKRLWNELVLTNGLSKREWKNPIILLRSMAMHPITRLEVRARVCLFLFVFLFFFKKQTQCRAFEHSAGNLVNVTSIRFFYAIRPPLCLYIYSSNIVAYDTMKTKTRNPSCQ